MNKEEFLKQIPEESELVRFLVVLFALCAVIGMGLFYGGYDMDPSRFGWFFCAITALLFLRARPRCITIRLRAAGKKRLVLTKNSSPNKKI